MSIALDKDTNVYVSDEYLHRITVFDKDGNYVSHWGTHGSGDGELDRPAGLAIHDDVLIVVDSRNNRLQRFTLDGKYISQFGSAGSGPGEFNTPWGIGLDGGRQHLRGRLAQRPRPVLHQRRPVAGQLRAAGHRRRRFHRP